MDVKIVYLVIEHPEPEEYSEGNSLIYAIATSRSKANEFLAEANKDGNRRFEIQEEEADKPINLVV